MTRSKTLVSKEKLLPEYIRALEFLDEKLDVLSASVVSEISTDIWKQGSILMFCEPFSARNLPSGKNWRWNQTKARKQAFLKKRGNAVVNFFKLSTRKRNVKDSGSIPGFKMWQFELFLHKEDEPVYIIWCEKGLQPEEEEEEEEKEQKPLDEPAMSMEELAFFHELLKVPETKDPLFSWPSNNSFEGLLMNQNFLCF